MRQPKKADIISGKIDMITLKDGKLYEVTFKTEEDRSVYKKVLEELKR